MVAGSCDNTPAITEENGSDNHRSIMGPDEDASVELPLSIHPPHEESPAILQSA